MLIQRVIASRFGAELSRAPAGSLIETDLKASQ